MSLYVTEKEWRMGNKDDLEKLMRRKDVVKYERA
jgi:hypothetical protein